MYAPLYAPVTESLAHGTANAGVTVLEQLLNQPAFLAGLLVGVLALAVGTLALLLRRSSR